MNLAFGGHPRDRSKIKAKSVLEPSAHPAGVYLSFLSMKRQEVLQLPPRMWCLFIARLPLPSSISSGFPNSTHDRTHLIILQGRGKYCENKVFCSKHNTLTSSSLQSEPLPLESSALTMRPLRLLTLYSHEWPRQNFSLQYKYNIRQTGDENKEKYKFEDFLVDPVPNSQN